LRDFLVVLFGIAPLPYIISAAVLKIPKRGYWKAFGSAILGGLAGSATMIVVILITAAITGSFASLGAGGNAITQLMPAMGAGCWWDG